MQVEWAPPRSLRVGDALVQNYSAAHNALHAADECSKRRGTVSVGKKSRPIKMVDDDHGKVSISCGVLLAVMDERFAMHPSDLP